MSERWHIVEEDDGRVLQVCDTPRRAMRAQKRWRNLWLYHDGPKTTVRRVAIKDEP